MGNTRSQITSYPFSDLQPVAFVPDMEQTLSDQKMVQEQQQQQQSVTIPSSTIVEEEEDLTDQQQKEKEELLMKQYQVPEYRDKESGMVHTYSKGENVMLIGSALEYAQKNQFLPLAKIVDLVKDDQDVVFARLQFFVNGVPKEQEGGIGIPRGAPQLYVLFDNVRPLPIHMVKTQPSIQDLQAMVRSMTCSSMNKNRPWECSSCDPDGILFEESYYREALQNVIDIMNQPGPLGRVRYIMFSCPGTIIRPEQPIRLSNAACKTVIFSIQNQGMNMPNRFALIGIADPVMFQIVMLKAYGMPTDAAYRRAVRWSQFDLYNQLVDYAQRTRITCADLDAVTVQQLVQGLMQRGYQQQEIAVLPEMKNVQ